LKKLIRGGNMALKVNNLAKSYGDKLVVDNLSFSIEEPGVFGLLGTNGAGKTTLVKSILGLINYNGSKLQQDI